eukprot:scaffold225833_cov19-Prasinocladus_malaysianus.AAC.2
MPVKAASQPGAAYLANRLRTGPCLGKLGTGDKDCRPVALSSGALGPDPRAGADEAVPCRLQYGRLLLSATAA